MNQLKKRRLEFEYSQLDVEKLTGISQTKISLFENEYRQPSPKEKKKLIRVFRMDEKELFPDHQKDA